MANEERGDEEMVLQPANPLVCERIEKIASVVAWNPKAELFLMQIMHGYPEFGFLDTQNRYHVCYCHRVAALRRQFLYSVCDDGDSDFFDESDVDEG